MGWKKRRSVMSVASKTLDDVIHELERTKELIWEGDLLGALSNVRWIEKTLEMIGGKEERERDRE